MLDPDRLLAAYRTARAALLAERTPAGHWVGELSASALSTATAVSALSLVGGHESLVAGGLRWLAEHANADGGWGDTVKSVSNISTTMLVRAAFRLAGADEPPGAVRWLNERYGTTPLQHAEAVRARYGRDRTFSVPILMNAALAGLVDWTEVPPLPFELACLPQSWYRFARLPVVSYALPALIAIGQTIFRHRRPRNPLARLVRRRAIGPSLRVLERMQPSSGGFLEATPLTSFVVMALASCRSGNVAADRVIDRGVAFLVESVRPDGSWPIDSNLSVWVTTLAVNALAAAGDLDVLTDKGTLTQWLLDRQEKVRHPFTGAAPGGWGWSHLPGSVPDADDTPGAMLALLALGESSPEVQLALKRGLHWLIDLQNRDGGLPTFCRGWGMLPFDRSGCDLTAHFLRALLPPGPVSEYRDPSTVGEVAQVIRDIASNVLRLDKLPYRQWAVQLSCEPKSFALNYLADRQEPDGSWLPLWFGNQHAPDDINPTYGTAKVLAAYRDLNIAGIEPAQRGVRWLLENQNDDGGWGGGRGTPSSVEETALAVEVLLDLAPAERRADVERGLTWLVARVEAGGLTDPSPIGFYFAKLWYFERLYPVIFAVAALGRATRRRTR